MIETVKGSIVEETVGSWKEEVEGVKYVNGLKKD